MGARVGINTTLTFEFVLHFRTKKTNIPAATASAAIDPTTAPTVIPVAPWIQELNNVWNICLLKLNYGNPPLNRFSHDAFFYT